MDEPLIEEEPHHTKSKYIEAFETWVGTCSCGAKSEDLGKDARIEAGVWCVNHRLQAKGLVA